MDSCEVLPDSNVPLSLTGGAAYFRPTRALSDTQVAFKLDSDQALAGLSSFDSRHVVQAFQKRYPRAFQLLGRCGVLPDGACDVLDPYTGIVRREPFNNIFEHSMAVGFAAQAIGRQLLRAKEITVAELDSAVEAALLHDATKPYELFRRRIGFYLKDAAKIFDAGKASGNMTANVFEQIFEMLLTKYKDPQAFAAHLKYTGWLFASGDLIALNDIQIMVDAACRVAVQHDLGATIVDSLEFTWDEFAEAKTDVRVQKLLTSVIDYGLIEACNFLPELLMECMPKEDALDLGLSGAETGWPSYGSFLAVSPCRNIVGVRGNWVDAIVHIADDMTSTNVPKEIENSETYFLTTNERLVASGLVIRVCGAMMNQWIGARCDGSVVELKNDEPLPCEARPVANVATLMIYITTSICERIKEIVSPTSAEAPDEFVKRLVNDSYEGLVFDRGEASLNTLAA